MRLSFRSFLLFVSLVVVSITSACSFSPFHQATSLPAAAPIEKTAIPGKPPQAEPTAASPTLPSNPLTNKIDEYIRKNHPLFSGSVLVAKDGQILLSKGYRWSNWELDVPNKPATKFRIASLTKPFTALAIMILQERGLLSVQDPVCKYVPDCPESWRPITIHHLLTHTSGIPDYTAFPDALEKAVQPISVEDLVAYFKDKPLDFTPGEKFSYSNSGYVLLGYILNLVSGESYPDFLQASILDPLKMKDTGYDLNRAVLKDRANGYSLIGKQLLNAKYLDMTNAYSAGGLYSTVEDLYRFDQALYTNQLVSDRILEMIFTPYVKAPELGGDYGYGWMISNAGDHRMIGHAGNIFGFRNILMRYPDDHLTIIILSNMDTNLTDTDPGNLQTIVHDIEEIVFDS